ncbi:type VI secretion system tube protein TssD [Enterobacter asburiae]|uniref:type VI secretion system tube protein TssD n=1 Tax=Enterobacter asburiae TaxID=61645 RepID=UPI0040698843
MPIPPYMWLKDDGGADIKGSVDVQDREGSIEIKFYHINDAGQEVCYYTVLMENVKVTGVNCSVPNVKIAANNKMNHVESVSLQYEKITWRIVDGNIMHSDAWNERPTAQR